MDDLCSLEKQGSHEESRCQRMFPGLKMVGIPAEEFLCVARPLVSRIRIDYALFVLQKVPVVKEEDEPEEEDEEEMGHAETYAEYMPIKCMSLGFAKIMKDFQVPLELKNFPTHVIIY